jgi:hypothetical protein
MLPFYAENFAALEENTNEWTRSDRRCPFDDTATATLKQHQLSIAKDKNYH